MPVAMTLMATRANVKTTHRSAPRRSTVRMFGNLIPGLPSASGPIWWVATVWTLWLCFMSAAAALVIAYFAVRILIAIGSLIAAAISGHMSAKENGNG